MADKTYSELNRTYEYDEAKATLMAEAMSEIYKIEQRKKYLQGLCNQNKGLLRFLWMAEDGRVLALQDIETDHLVNILNYLHDNGREISKPMEAEARKRNIALPTETKLLGMSASDLVW